MKASKNHPTRKLYTSELDLPEEHIKPFFDWYAYRHAPDIYQIGFEVCTSYRAIEGDMAIFDLYEINTVDVFDTAKYRAVSANDPYSTSLLANRKAKAHSIYAQLYVAPEPEEKWGTLSHCSDSAPTGCLGKGTSRVENGQRAGLQNRVVRDRARCKRRPDR